MKMYFALKIQNTRTRYLKEIFRYICTSNERYDNSKQIKFMNKFIKRNETKRDPAELMLNSLDYIAPRKQLSVYTRRRMTVLNKIFMEHITEILSTGEIDPEILDKNIEISHVKVTADFKLINVYWVNNDVNSSNIDELLKKCAFELRHRLSQLRIIGNVPPIQFVKYGNAQKFKEVEEILNTLNCGEDHVPITYPTAIYHTVIASKISSEDQESQDVLEKGDKNDIFSVSVPIMKHNVFGVDHHRIMSKIKASLATAKKARNVLITKAQPNINSGTIDVQSMPNYLTDEKQQEKFTKFLRLWQKEQKRKNKERNDKRNEFIDVADGIHNNDSLDDLDSNYYDFPDEFNSEFDEYVEEKFDKVP